MKIVKKIEIASSTADVWNIIGNEFLPVDTWMAGVRNSHEINIGTKLEGAPVIGRRAEVATVPGSYLEERITAYNPDNMSLAIETKLMNSPGPLDGYGTEIKVEETENGTSEVTWTSWASVQLVSSEIYSAVIGGLDAGFYRGLEELKCFVETGTPHERKLSEKATCG